MNQMNAPILPILQLAARIPAVKTREAQFSYEDDY
jgi:hypothetical protein